MAHFNKGYVASAVAVFVTLLALAFAPTAVLPAGILDDDMRIIEEDVRKQLSSSLSMSLKIGERAQKDGRFTYGLLKDAKLEMFELNGAISFEHGMSDKKSKQKATVWTKVSFKFSARVMPLNADFDKWDSGIHDQHFGVYTVERLNQPFEAAGSIKRNTHDEGLLYEMEGSSFKSGIREGFATKTSVSDKNGKKLSSHGEDDSTYHKLEQLFEFAVSSPLEKAVANAFSAALRDLQWKQGPEGLIGLDADSIRQLINVFLLNKAGGKDAFGFKLQSPFRIFSAKSDVRCKLIGTPVKIGSIALRDVAKQGPALLVSFEISKAMVDCVADADSKSKSRGLEIPNLSTTVGLELIASNPGTAYAVRCEPVEHERLDISATNPAKIPADVLNDLDRKLGKEACLLVREIALMSMSNFVGLRKATFDRD